MSPQIESGLSPDAITTKPTHERKDRFADKRKKDKHLNSSTRSSTNGYSW